MIKDKRLICQKIFYFAYKKRGANIANNTILANCYLDLSKAELRRKKEIITDYYGFSKNSFEAKSSKKRETFWLINN